MSLLDRTNETVTIYPEVVTIDADGNTITKPSDTGFEQPVWIYPAAQSGTSSRRAEQDNEGFETEDVYKMRLPRSYAGDPIGAQGRIDWNGEYWAVIGYPLSQNGSRRTRHSIYTIRRS
ncbi:hypothetical protein [Amycolatopsis sp.]|uniref:hypothetical protein n=1 Tax=Amycolatopsis sp. TaxID=37632 RepID=UPI002BA016C6|nr:hypothetical protein [Amycolatopsis sp.]HVV11580.1 hypothetical protein [Amycolatopsis sp.]